MVGQKERTEEKKEGKQIQNVLSAGTKTTHSLSTELT